MPPPAYPVANEPRLVARIGCFDSSGRSHLLYMPPRRGCWSLLERGHSTRLLHSVEASTTMPTSALPRRQEAHRWRTWTFTKSIRKSRLHSMLWCLPPQQSDPPVVAGTPSKEKTSTKSARHSL